MLLSFAWNKTPGSDLGGDNSSGSSSYDYTSPDGSFSSSSTSSWTATYSQTFQDVTFFMYGMSFTRTVETGWTSEVHSVTDSTSTSTPTDGSTGANTVTTHTDTDLTYTGTLDSGAMSGSPNPSQAVTNYDLKASSTETRKTSQTTTGGGGTDSVTGSAKLSWTLTASGQCQGSGSYTYDAGGKTTATDIQTQGSPGERGFGNVTSQAGNQFTTHVMGSDPSSDPSSYTSSDTAMNGFTSTSVVGGGSSDGSIQFDATVTSSGYQTATVTDNSGSDPNLTVSWGGNSSMNGSLSGPGATIPLNFMAGSSNSYASGGGSAGVGDVPLSFGLMGPGFTSDYTSYRISVQQPLVNLRPGNTVADQYYNWLASQWNNGWIRWPFDGLAPQGGGPNLDPPFPGASITQPQTARPFIGPPLWSGAFSGIVLTPYVNLNNNTSGFSWVCYFWGIRTDFGDVRTQ